MRYPIASKSYSYDEELEIFRVIRTGESAEKLLSSKHSFDTDFYAKLQTEAEAGRAARKEFITNNLPLCVAAVNTFCSSFILKYPEQEDDLISEATIGMMRAVDKFDPAYGTKFSTYAMIWIRNFMLRYIYKNSHYLSGSISSLCQYLKVEKLITNYIEEHDVFPSVEMISSETGSSILQIKRFLMIMQSPIRLDKKLRIQSECIWDESIYDNHDVISLDNIDFDENLMHQEMITFLQENLYSKEIRIIKDYFGFNSVSKSYAKIGAELGISRERVRQIINHSLFKLKDAYKKQIVQQAKNRSSKDSEENQGEQNTIQSGLNFKQNPSQNKEETVFVKNNNSFDPSKTMVNYFLVFFKENNIIKKEICVAKNKFDVCRNYKNYNFYIVFDSNTKEFLKNKNENTKIINLM